MSKEEKRNQVKSSGKSDRNVGFLFQSGYASTSRFDCQKTSLPTSSRVKTCSEFIPTMLKRNTYSAGGTHRERALQPPLAALKLPNAMLGTIPASQDPNPNSHQVTPPYSIGILLEFRIPLGRQRTPARAYEYHSHQPFGS